MIFLLFLLGIALKSISSQLIVTSNSKKNGMEKIKKVYDSILADLPSIFISCNFPSIQDETMTIDKISYNSYYSYTNPYFYFDKHIITYSPRQFSIIFNFRCTLKSSEEIYSNFTMKITSLSIKEQHEKYKFTPKIAIDVSENDFRYEKEEENNDDIKEQMLTLIKKHFFVDNSQIFETQFYGLISSNINMFYKDVKNIDIILSEQFGEEKLNISLNTFCGFCTDVKLTGETIQCYYMGNVTETQYFDRQGDIEEYDDFFKDDGKFKIFVSYLLVSDTMNTEAFKSSAFDFSEKTKPKEVEKLIVENLLYFFPNLYKVLPRQESFHVRSKIENAKLSDINTGNAMMTHYFYFNNDETKSVIILQTEFLFKVKYTAFATNMNACFENVKFVKIKNKSQNIFQKLEHVNEFLTLLDSIFNSYISSNELCLYKGKGMDFVEYFKLIEDIHVGKNGIFLKGKSV